MTPKHQFLMALIFFSVVLTWILIRYGGIFPGPPGQDFYQLWLGARMLIHGSSPYGEVVQREMSRAYGQWGGHSLPYPLPAVMVVTPLAILPLGTALVVWLSLNLVALSAPVWLQRKGHYHLLLLLVFLPLVRTVGIAQPTLMWTSLAILLVVALQRGWSIPAGLCLALLPAKPQAGLIFATVGAMWALRHQRRALVWAGLWSLVIWGESFLLVPDWLGPVVTSVRRYSVLYPAPSLLPLGLLVIVAAYRLPWWGVAAAAQVILFPVRDIYSTLPLLVGWIAIGGPLGLIGAGLSWGWFALSSLPFVPRLWVSIFLPFAAAALWRAFTVRHNNAGNMARVCAYRWRAVLAT